MSEQTWSTVDDYLSDVLLGDDPVLDATVARADAAGLPSIQVSATQGKQLMLLARAVGARRVLEVGTLGGYSAIWLARALPADGHLDTCEIDPLHAETARASIAEAGFADRVTVHLGAGRRHHRPARRPRASRRTTSRSSTPTSRATPTMSRATLALSHPGTLIVVDNVVRNGRVADATSEDASVVGTRRLFDYLAGEPRLDATAIQTVGSQGLRRLRPGPRHPALITWQPIAGRLAEAEVDEALLGDDEAVLGLGALLLGERQAALGAFSASSAASSSAWTAARASWADATRRWAASADSFAVATRSVALARSVRASATTFSAARTALVCAALGAARLVGVGDDREVRLGRSGLAEPGVRQLGGEPALEQGRGRRRVGQCGVQAACDLLHESRRQRMTLCRSEGAGPQGHRADDLLTLTGQGAQRRTRQGPLGAAQLVAEGEQLVDLDPVLADQMVERPRRDRGLAQLLDLLGGHRVTAGAERGRGRVTRRDERVRREPVQLVRDRLELRHPPILTCRGR